MCDSVVCTICTTVVGENHEGNDEESKKVGVCKNCQSCSSVPERPAEPLRTRKVQVTLFSMLSRSNKRSLLSSATSAKNTNSRKQARTNSTPATRPQKSSVDTTEINVAEDVSVPQTAKTRKWKYKPEHPIYLQKNALFQTIQLKRFQMSQQCIKRNYLMYLRKYFLICEGNKFKTFIFVQIEIVRICVWKTPLK